MKSRLLQNLRDIFLLPFTVAVIIPFFLYNPDEKFTPDHPALLSIGGFCFLIGLAMFAYTLFLFNVIGKGTLAPWSRKQKLITTGPYAYCRNPMIAGVWLILSGEGLVLRSTAILWWSVFFFLINTLYVVLYEEPTLAARFGEDYVKYKKHVPRWIPRIKPYNVRN